jgi:hypothetical protein
MVEFLLASLNPQQPTGFLAALGLASCGGGELSFPAGEQVVLTHDEPAEAVAVRAIECLDRLVSPRVIPDIAGWRTTTPPWSVIAPMCSASWHDPVADSVLRTIDVGSVKSDASADSEPQTLSGALVLISGKSYVRKAAQDLWPVAPLGMDPAEHHRHQMAARVDDLAMLLSGRRPSVSTESMYFRYSVSEASPRLRLGVEVASAVPLIEMLAMAGVFSLLPRQRGADGKPGLHWALNPLPLGARALVDLHEARGWPKTWPTWTAAVRVVGGGTKASEFALIGEVVR